MAKKKSQLFECQHCGFSSTKWMGKCPGCDSWDSFVEVPESVKKAAASTKQHAGSLTPQPITEISQDKITRFPSGETELDLVLGGGIVDSSLTLIGGSPGVGKSTLLLKIAGNLAKSGQKVLYVSGEESLGQIRLRGERLGSLHDSLHLLAEIKLQNIFAACQHDAYDILILDSIQTIYTEELTSAPGSVSQVREVTFDLMRLAKEQGLAIFIIGHITKEGSIAGPRVLEHMVDVVLYFEGDSSRELRMLRGFKNRFGSTSEVGIFEMTEQGLISAQSFASAFYTKKEARPGSAVTVIMEGSRALVIEVQALVADSGGHPKRSATGFDSSRLTMLLALLEKKLNLPFYQYDVFINISGGIKIQETSADLAVVAAIISSYQNRPLSNESVFIGEVSLIGDIREVPNIDQRLREAKTQGFNKAVVPKAPKNPVIKCFEADEATKIVDWM